MVPPSVGGTYPEYPLGVHSVSHVQDLQSEPESTPAKIARHHNSMH